MILNISGEFGHKNGGIKGIFNNYNRLSTFYEYFLPTSVFNDGKFYIKI